MTRAAAGATHAIVIGEIGLDYHYDFAPRDIQREVFARQIAIARARGLPIIIHTREADDDTLDILRSAGRPSVAAGGPLARLDGAAAGAKVGLGHRREVQVMV